MGIKVIQSVLELIKYYKKIQNKIGFNFLDRLSKESDIL